YAQAVWDHITDSLTNPPSGTTLQFFMLHHPLSPNYYGSGETVDMATELLSLMSTNGVDYFLHGHLHSDAYDVHDGIVHIGTDNSVGGPSYSGLRIIEMSGDTMTRFSYGTPDQANYDASSYPILQINATFESPNDGTASSNTAHLSNGFNTSLPNAKVTFALAPPGAMMRYKSDDGSVLDTWVQDGVHFVEVGVVLSGMTNMSISVSQEEYTTTTTTEDVATTEDTTTGETTVEETTDGGAPAVPLGYILSVIGAIVVIRRSRKK
ncbi:MAG: metallophosphoesterase family protein, partial [Candidatus Hodarchaeales archaeon]